MRNLFITKRCQQKELSNNCEKVDDNYANSVQDNGGGDNSKGSNTTNLEQHLGASWNNLDCSQCKQKGKCVANNCQETTKEDDSLVTGLGNMWYYLDGVANILLHHNLIFDSKWMIDHSSHKFKISGNVQDLSIDCGTSKGIKVCFFPITEGLHIKDCL